MKNNLTRTLFIFAFLCKLQASAQQFTLSGKLSGIADAPLLLRYINSEGKTITDSTNIQNGSFIFKGSINGGMLASLSVSSSSTTFKTGRDQNAVRIFLDSGSIIAEGSYSNLKKLKISGSKSEAENSILSEKFQPYEKYLDSAENVWLADQSELFKVMKIHKDGPKQHRIEHTMDSLDDVMMSIIKRVNTEFINEHPDSYVSAYTLFEYKSRWTFKKTKETYNLLSPAVLNGYYGLQVKEYINKIEANSAGKVAKKFSIADINGKTISLADFKGRYVLLDFWGSWCAPCRASTPHVKELFTKYHNSGLDVLAIACDDTPADWKEAIAKDGTDIFYNILQEKRSTANKNTLIDDQYNIHVFPTKILIGKDGIIVGRYDGTESTNTLDAKLAEIFN